MTIKELKEKHNILVRNAVRTVAGLQSVMNDNDTPEHVKPFLLACLEVLDKGLVGQPLEDERIVIEVVDGVAYVASKTEYVEVVIHDLDNGFDE